jgi:hypothetical protein
VGLALEARPAVRVGGHLRRKDFEGNGAVETGVAGLVHLALDLIRIGGRVD